MEALGDFSPDSYREAAVEHVDAIRLLYDEGEYVLAIYVSGVAVECVLRAYQTRLSNAIDSKHNLHRLARESKLPDRVPVPLLAAYNSDLSCVAVRWSNGHRFRSEQSLRRFLKRAHADRGIKGDFLKENARLVLNAATRLVQLGNRLWTR